MRYPCHRRGMAYASHGPAMRRKGVTFTQTTVQTAPAIRNRARNSGGTMPSAGRLVSLADEEGVREILAATVLDLWRVVNNLTRLRPSARERYRVAIFGSARAQPGTFVYDEVKRVAAAFASLGCDIVTGGGPGLM